MKKPLRIGLIMQGGREWIGGTQYIKNIVLALASLPPEVRSTFEIYLICSKSVDAKLYNQIQPHLNKIYYIEEIFRPLRIKRPKILKTLKSIFFSLKKLDFVYPMVDDSPIYKTYVSASWIPDFQDKYLPHFFSKEEIAQRGEISRLTANQSSTVILSSKTVESDFQKFFPNVAHKSKVLQFRTSPEPTWYEGNPEETQNKYHLPERFFLVSNQFWQHKNHLVIFEALKLLREKSIYPIVVCTGNIYDHRKPDYSDIILQTIHKLRISQQVYLLGLIPRLEQIQLIRRSIAMIQPSLFEGWSTVVEDAKCLGKQIIISDIAVHLEQNPPNSIFFERHSTENLASILAECWEDLVPGPNLEKEAIARNNNQSETQAFGYRFLEIAKGNKS